MAHNHDHHTHSPESFNLAFALAVGLNLGFTVIEAVYAIMANSMSLLADAGHNLGDVLGLVLAWGANWLLTKPSSERYSYGFKRTSILAAIANALFLVAACAIITYESIAKLLNPQPVHEMTVIIVAAIGIVINLGTALLSIRGSKDDLNIKGAFLHLASDALVSVGVVIAGVIIIASGWLWVDPLAGLLIVVTILLGSWGLLRDSVNLILDAVPHDVDHKAVKTYLAQLPGVTAVHDLHIWGLSTKETALTAHLVIPDAQTDDNFLQTICHDLKRNFKINHPTIQIENGGDCHTQTCTD